MTPLNVLVLSWNYPTPAAPQRGLWVQRMVHAAALRARVTAIVPTPWVPPGLPIEALSRFRRVPQHSVEAGGAVDVHFPRVAGSIEYYTHVHDARLSSARVDASSEIDATSTHQNRPVTIRRMTCLLECVCGSACVCHTRMPYRSLILCPENSPSSPQFQL